MCLFEIGRIRSVKNPFIPNIISFQKAWEIRRDKSSVWSPGLWGPSGVQNFLPSSGVQTGVLARDAKLLEISKSHEIKWKLGKGRVGIYSFLSRLNFFS